MNLIVKSILKQFDIPKDLTKKTKTANDETLQELATLAVDLDLEEEAAQQGLCTTTDSGKEDEDDNKYGFID